MNIFSSHLSFERLVDLVEGRLPPAEQTPLLTHLSSCTRCAAEKAWLERVIGLMRADTNEDAPPAVIARAQRLFQTRVAPVSPEAATGSPLRRRISALLHFDSLQRPLALGMRGGQPAARQLLLKAEDYELDVRITPAGTTWQVSGQLLGPETKGQVELRRAAGDSPPVPGTTQPKSDRDSSQDATGMLQAELNDLGEFNLPPARPGVYQLLLRLGNLEVELPPLEIGAGNGG
jgi:hypothetical protein